MNKDSRENNALAISLSLSLCLSLPLTASLIELNRIRIEQEIESNQIESNRIDSSDIQEIGTRFIDMGSHWIAS